MSPCRASTGSSTTAVEPVLERVAAILRPMLPDLPMPTTTSLSRRARAATTRSTARSKEASSAAPTAFNAASSMAKTSRARAICDMPDDGRIAATERRTKKSAVWTRAPAVAAEILCRRTHGNC